MFWNTERRMTQEDMNQFTWQTLKGSADIDDSKLKETTYFKCIKYISESVAKCPLSVRQETEKGEVDAKQHRLYTKLRLRPNEYMSSIDVMKAFVAIAEHTGVGGLYIDRKTMSLYPVLIDKIVIDDVGLLNSTKQNKVLVEFNLMGTKGACLEKDIVMFKAGMSFDGINTTSNGELLSQTIKTTQKAQNYLSDIFDNGLTNKLVVQVSNDIKEEKELKKIQDKFGRLFSSNGRTFTVPAGFNVSALNLSLSDAQFEQLRKLSRREIANAFGLSPSIIGDLEDSNNNNMEMQNLSFLVDTLLIKLQQIEQELDYKLLTENERIQGYKIRFNQSVMLRTDSKKQSEIITAYAKGGIYTVNDARRILGETKLDGCDEPLVPSGTYKLSQLDKVVGDKTGGGDE